MRFRWIVTLGLLLAIVLGPASSLHARADLAPRPEFGFVWDNAGKVYVLHLDENNVRASDPSLPFRVARQNQVTTVRVFLGVQEVLARWRSDRAGTLADVRKMLDDAQANGLHLVLSTYLTQGAVEVLGGRSFPDLPSAQRDITRPGSGAYVALADWLGTLASTFRDHPAAYSFEVTNEPAWMLGVDTGAVNKDQVADFLAAMFRTLKTAGARNTNMGGARLDSMTDDQLRRAVEYCDILDMHFYPDVASAGSPYPEVLMGRFQEHIDRVHNLTGRVRPAMVGEVGTVPWGWFLNVTRASLARGWATLAWVFDGWDQYAFDQTKRPEVLAHLESTNLVPTPRQGFTADPEAPVAGQAAIFEANSPFDPNSTLVSYAWDFGDGTRVEGDRVEHAFARVGSHRVTLVANYAWGESVNSSLDIQVGTPPFNPFASPALLPTPLAPPTACATECGQKGLARMLNPGWPTALAVGLLGWLTLRRVPGTRRTPRDRGPRRP